MFIKERYNYKQSSQQNYIFLCEDTDKNSLFFNRLLPTQYINKKKFFIF